VVMKNILFWDITPCSPLKVNPLFGGTYRLHLQGRRISQARNQQVASRAICLRIARVLQDPDSLAPIGSERERSETIGDEARIIAVFTIKHRKPTRHWTRSWSGVIHVKCYFPKAYEHKTTVTSALYPVSFTFCIKHFPFTRDMLILLYVIFHSIRMSPWLGKLSLEDYVLL
jgi:hypothetical protein